MKYKVKEDLQIGLKYWTIECMWTHAVMWWEIIEVEWENPFKYEDVFFDKSMLEEYDESNTNPVLWYNKKEIKKTIIKYKPDEIEENVYKRKVKDAFDMAMMLPEEKRKEWFNKMLDIIFD